jgi:DNA-binding NtrC family response regulator
MAAILLVDDDEILLVTLEQLLTERGHSVVTASDGKKAAKLLRAKPFELVITDIVMPDRDGIETIITLHREFPEIGIIAMSGGVSRSPTYLALAARLGAYCTLSKPFTPQQLQHAINETLAAKRA